MPYPLLVAEFPGFTLDHHDTPAFKDAIVPQGRAKDAAAQNANLVLLDVLAGVDSTAIVSACITLAGESKGNCLLRR